MLEWVAIPFSRGSSQPRDQTQASHIAGGFFTSWATREALPSTCMSAKSWMGLHWFLCICSFSAYMQPFVSLSLSHLQKNIENRQKNNVLFFFVLTCPGLCFFFNKLMSCIHFLWGTESLFSPPQEDFAFSVFKKRIGMCVIAGSGPNQKLEERKTHDILLVFCLRSFSLTSISGQLKSCGLRGVGLEMGRRNVHASSKANFSIVWQLLSNKKRCSRFGFFYFFTCDPKSLAIHHASQEW